MSEYPDGLTEFLRASGWENAAIEAIEGDASFRRYFRILDGERKAMLMHAPPPDEDPVPFLHVAKWLSQNSLRAPEIFSAESEQGWVLLEDFGNDRMRDWLDAAPDGENAAYSGAIDTLVALHQCEPGPFAPYDMDVYLRETDLLPEWYCPAMQLDVDTAGYRAAWRDALAPTVANQQPGVTVLRDYHAENIMLLGDPRAGAQQGLIDFQDALVGHPAYDLVSLLQDARRDVSEELEAQMLERYCMATDTDDDFLADYARLGAQRNAKIVGIFARLYKRDGKPRYLDMIPRVWNAMERDLAHPALEPVANWFDTNIPDELRKSGGGTIG